MSFNFALTFSQKRYFSVSLLPFAIFWHPSGNYAGNAPIHSGLSVGG